MPIRACSRALVIGLLLIPTLASAVYQSNIDFAATWLGARQNTDGSWGSNPSERFLLTSESVLALRAIGRRDSAYTKGIVWLENHAASNADFSSRKASLLGPRGNDVSAIIAQLETQQNTGTAGRQGWGVSESYVQSPLDTALVVRGLANLSTQADLQAGIGFLKAQQLEGSIRGWPATVGGATTDPHTSAQVLLALALFQSQDSSLAVPIADGVGALSTLVTASSPDHLKALAARAALRSGDWTAAQSWLNALAAAQNGNGALSDRIYDTALAMQAFAAADGIDTEENRATVSIPDKNLLAAINTALGRNAMDSLDRAELLRLNELTAIGQGISDLTGLEWASNLQSADLRDNNISSTAPIDGLTQLTSLILDGNPVDSGSTPPRKQVPLPSWTTVLLVLLLLYSASVSLRNIRQAGKEPETRI